MNNEEIIKNAPEGATHFDEVPTWYKRVEDGYEVWMKDEKCWRLMPNSDIECPDDIHNLDDIRRIVELEKERDKRDLEQQIAALESIEFDFAWSSSDYCKLAESIQDKIEQLRKEQSND